MRLDFASLRSMCGARRGVVWRAVWHDVVWRRRVCLTHRYLHIYEAGTDCERGGSGTT